jgi:trigger factor
MQVSVVSTGSLKREMKVEVPEERIASEVENRLKSLSRTTKIQGFRQGKVPFKVIENRYGKQVRMEVVGEVVQASFYEAVRQQNLRPAGRPYIDPLSAEQGKGLSYTAVFEVMPEFKLADAAKLEIEKPVCEVSESDYTKMVEVLRKQRRTLRPVEREARQGDTVDIDFDGRVDGEPFEGGTATDFKVELGLNRLIAGFEDGLLAKKAGDQVRLDLKFPEPYQSEKLAGKPVVFEVKIKQVFEPVLPELNQEFFTNFGVKEGGEEAFKKEVMQQMQREASDAGRMRLRDVVMNALYRENTIELPESLVHEEAHNLYHQFEDRMKAYGIQPKAGADTDHNHDLSMFQEQARKRVALQLVVMEIIRAQQLKADPVKVRTVIEKNASSYQDPGSVINWYYSDKQRMAEAESVVLEDEVIDWICKTAKVNPVNVTFDELMNKGQTGAE